jgi:hypothetical protein
VPQISVRKQERKFIRDYNLCAQQQRYLGNSEVDSLNDECKIKSRVTQQTCDTTHQQLSVNVMMQQLSKGLFINNF